MSSILPLRVQLASLCAGFLILLAAAPPALALDRFDGAVTLGYDRLTMRLPFPPDRTLRGPSLNLGAHLAKGRFGLEAEARLRRLSTGHSRYDLRWLDLAPGYAVTPALRLGLYHTRFPMRLRNDHSASHRWQATGVSLDWTAERLRLRAIAGQLDGNGGGRAREAGVSAELLLGGSTALGAMRNQVRGRSGAFRYDTAGAWLAHEFDFGLTVWAGLQELRLRPGSERLRTRTLGLAQRVTLAGRTVILSAEASRSTPRLAPQRIDVIRVGLTIPLGGAAVRAPLNSTLAAMQRRPNFLFGFFDTVISAM